MLVSRLCKLDHSRRPFLFNIPQLSIKLLLYYSNKFLAYKVQVNFSERTLIRLGFTTSPETFVGVCDERQRHDSVDTHLTTFLTWYLDCVAHSHLHMPWTDAFFSCFQATQAILQQSAAETARRSLDTLMTQQRQQQTAYNLQILRGLLSNAFPTAGSPQPSPQPLQQPPFHFQGPHPPPNPPGGIPNPNSMGSSSLLPDSYAEYTAWLQQPR